MGSDDSQSEADSDPVLKRDSIPLRHNVNRIRCLNGSPIVALWSENAEVIVVNLMRRYDALVNKEYSKEQPWRKSFKN